MKKVYFYNYPVGPLGIAEDSGAISRIFFSDKKELPQNSRVKHIIIEKTSFELEETPLIKKAADQLVEYFDGKRKRFDLPLLLNGTEFQRSVWNALLAIPYGETRSYGDIASLVGNPKACRAVGMANNRNPIVIIVPCHRIIGKDLSLTGYGGGLANKKLLLELENALP